MNILGILSVSLAMNTWGVAMFNLHSYPEWAHPVNKTAIALVPFSSVPPLNATLWLRSYWWINTSVWDLEYPSLNSNKSLNLSQCSKSFSCYWILKTYSNVIVHSVTILVSPRVSKSFGGHFSFFFSFWSHKWFQFYKAFDSLFKKSLSLLFGVICVTSRLTSAGWTRGTSVNNYT